MMLKREEVNRLFSRLTVREQALLCQCKECFAIVVYANRYGHAQWHEDERAKARRLQDELPLK